MKSGWIITRDILEQKDVTIIGPRECQLLKEELLKGVEFKLYDDDGVLYYEGFFVGDHQGYDGFMPLENYGAPAAGCTEIRYKTKNGFKTL